MITIQIITINTDKVNTRVMIEQYSSDEYTVQIDTKTHEEKYYNGFQLYLDRNGAVVFTSAKEALKYTLDSFFQNQNIQSITNKVARLLTTDEIKEVTKVENIKEV